ncbi:MAG TPA: sigma 54-interacting transcriptional regulator [Terriglobales bacterium]|nr:sigma 54-interacting transcriptional regulator [Terriglobales bacterium]
MAKEFPEFAETKDLVGTLDPNGNFVEGLGQSMKALDVVIRELARSEVPVLLLAETGAGKKSAAERIHQMSAHQAEPFQVIRCADVTEPMLSENGRAGGLFEAGTVYFDELADLSAECQEALLAVLESGNSNGNGHALRARLICGSERDLEAEVKAGRFREDTYDRLSGVCLRLPPLRQRREDIPALVNFFLAKYARDFRRPVPQLSPATQLLFHDYAWPGNIRELEDAARAIVALGDESVAMGGLRSLLMRSERNGNGERISLKQASRAASREAEKELILRVLQRTRWNRRRAAQELQISYKALLYKLKQIGYQDYGAS